MITIFNGHGLRMGEKRGDKPNERVYAQIDLAMREHLNVFCHHSNLNSFAVFMCIALHTDQYGWAFPSRETLCKELGLKEEGAITRALIHLRDAEINGERLVLTYRQKDPQTHRWGRTAYLLFPDNWTDISVALTHAPLKNLVPWNPREDKNPPPPPIIQGWINPPIHPP